MTHCMHGDTTLVDTFVTKKGRSVRIEECNDCGRTFKQVDGAVVTNFPNTSYIYLSL